MRDNERNGSGIRDAVAAEAIRNADRPPESVRHFRQAMKLMCIICHVRILGKVTVVDEKGHRW